MNHEEEKPSSAQPEGSGPAEGSQQPVAEGAPAEGSE